MATPKIKGEQQKCKNGTQIWFDHNFQRQHRNVVVQSCIGTHLFEECTRCAYKILAIRNMDGATAAENYSNFAQHGHRNSLAIQRYAFGIRWSQHQHRPVASNLMSIYKIVIFIFVLLSRTHNRKLFVRVASTTPSTGPSRVHSRVCACSMCNRKYLSR